ncbi:6-phosphogluconolactonase [Nocardioides sp. 616]|uniref:6-phosphogluconolactonase n=1 Tax=Nocardioides sp. 616 TaxID=2268090 RepID=UPI000CE5494C|nr:6-phosphogluconolactonase [Nocardioides sp. 616]
MTASVKTHEDAAELASEVASRLLARLEELQAQGRVPQVVLTGGSVADVVHREVARRAQDCSVDWSRVALWWGDERFVEAGSGDRNCRQAAEAWLDQVGVDPALVHEVPAQGEAESAEAAADAYDALLARTVLGPGSTGFDLVMLGLGPDGHVASLFPGRPEVEVDTRHAVAVHDSPKPPPDRVSLTLPALCRTSEVWFLVSGHEKADAVASAVAGLSPGSAGSPAARVHGREATIWFLDSSAASRLE